MTYTEFGLLKEVIVGVELDIPERQVDFTYKYFYSQNLGEGCVYDMQFYKYKAQAQILKERLEDLDNLAKILQDHNIKVYRPTINNKLEKIVTPTFSAYTSVANNVRDIIFAYGNMLIETPLLVRNRVYENLHLYDIIKQKQDNLFVRAPFTRLNEQSLDLDNWEIERDFNNIPDRYEMGLDAAQCIRIGKDVIVNVANYNHYLGFMWLKKFFPETNWHMVKLADNHIDGTILPLCPGKFLANGIYLDKNDLRDKLPAKFRKWDIIYSNDIHVDQKKFWTQISKDDIQLASSRGMDINVLSLDENTVLIQASAIKTGELLSKHGFNVIPITFRHGEFFGGGIHCSTLDLERVDEYIDYTK